MRIGVINCTTPRDARGAIKQSIVELLLLLLLLLLLTSALSLFRKCARAYEEKSKYKVCARAYLAAAISFQWPETRVAVDTVVVVSVIKNY